MGEQAIREVFKIGGPMSVSPLTKRFYQLLDLCFAGVVLGLDSLLVFLFENLKIAFRQLYANEVFDFVNGRLESLSSSIRPPREHDRALGVHAKCTFGTGQRQPGNHQDPVRRRTQRVCCKARLP